MKILGNVESLDSVISQLKLNSILRLSIIVILIHSGLSSFSLQHQIVQLSTIISISPNSNLLVCVFMTTIFRYLFPCKLTVNQM